MLANDAYSGLFNTLLAAMNTFFMDRSDFRPSTNRLSPWKMAPIDFGILVCMIMCSIFLFSSLGMNAYTWLIGDERGEDNLLPIIFGGFGHQIGGIFGYLLFVKMLSSPKRGNPLSNLHSIVYGVVGLLVAYGALIVVAPLWKSILEFFQVPFEFQEPVQMLMQAGKPWEKGLLYLLIVVGAPLGEEIVFRAAIFRYLNGKLPLVLSVGITSVLFALLHNNIYSFVPLVALGSVMCLVYQKSGNLLSCIVLHMLFNLTNLLFITHMPKSLEGF